MKIHVKGLYAALLLLLFANVLVAADLHDLSSYKPNRAYDHDYYIESNLEFTLLHEFAHAMIHINQVPVLGGQEQAADQIAVMLMIASGHSLDSALSDKLLAVSGEWMMEWQEEIEAEEVIFWDSHPLTIQRFYDLACLVYGADPEAVETIRRNSWLPIERAWYCSEEYIDSRKSLAWLAKQYSHVSFDAHWKIIDQDRQSPNKGKVVLKVLPPITEKDRKSYQFLSNSQRLNQFVSRINRALKLDRDINIVFDPACSEPNAWWNSDKETIFVCYALIEQFSRHSKHLVAIVDQLKHPPLYTLVLKIPEDVRVRMKKASISTSQINEQFIHWFRHQNAMPDD